MNISFLKVSNELLKIIVFSGLLLGCIVKINSYQDPEISPLFYDTLLTHFNGCWVYENLALVLKKLDQVTAKKLKYTFIRAAALAN